MGAAGVPAWAFSFFKLMKKISQSTHARLALLSVVLMAAGAALCVWQFLRMEVVIAVDGLPPNRQIVWAGSVEGALAAAGWELADTDRVVPGRDSWVYPGAVIRVSRTMAVRVYIPGAVLAIDTAERVPANILAELGLAVYAGDVVLVNGVPADASRPMPDAPATALELRPALAFELNVNGEAGQFFGAGPVVAAALAQNRISLKQADSVLPPLGDVLEENASLLLTSGQPVSIAVDGMTLETVVAGASVGEALAAAGVALQGLDYSRPAADAPLPADRQIQVVRVREEVRLEQNLLPFATELQPLPEVDIDTLQIIQAGEFGLEAERVRIRYEDGEEVSREVEDSWVARDAVPRIQGYGTKITIRTLNTPDGTIEYWRAVDVYATSYAPANAGTPVTAPNYGITYSGAPLRKGHIAVIRSWYPSLAGGSYYVPGYGFGTVADIGGGIRGRYWIDLGYPDEEYVPWHQTVTLYFLTPVPPESSILWILP